MLCHKNNRLLKSEVKQYGECLHVSCITPGESIRFAQKRNNLKKYCGYFAQNYMTYLQLGKQVPDCATISPRLVKISGGMLLPSRIREDASAQGASATVE